MTANGSETQLLRWLNISAIKGQQAITDRLHWLWGETSRWREVSPNAEDAFAQVYGEESGFQIRVTFPLILCKTKAAAQNQSPQTIITKLMVISVIVIIIYSELMWASWLVVTLFWEPFSCLEVKFIKCTGCQYARTMVWRKKINQEVTKRKEMPFVLLRMTQ